MLLIQVGSRRKLLLSRKITRFEVSRMQSSLLYAPDNLIKIPNSDPQISISSTRKPIRPLCYPPSLLHQEARHSQDCIHDDEGVVSSTRGLQWDNGVLLTLLIVVVSDNNKVVGQTRHRRILLSVLILRLKSSSPTTDGRRHLKPKRYAGKSHP